VTLDESVPELELVGEFWSETPVSVPGMVEPPAELPGESGSVVARLVGGCSELWPALADVVLMS
tara:strand:- start:769 stop:960 length:192 start_codon:yes stop_codon:yes gene_type:complete